MFKLCVIKGSSRGREYDEAKLGIQLKTILGMPVVFLDGGLKNTTNIGRIERGLGVMGCVVSRVLNKYKTRTCGKALAFLT